jgi:hypothetical protein
MNRRGWIWLLAFSLGLNAVLVGGWLAARAWDETDRGGKHRHGEDWMEVDMDRLTLTGDQRRQWTQIERRHALEEFRQHEKAAQRFDRLGALLLSDDLSTPTLQATLREMSGGMEGFILRRVGELRSKREILTPRQLEMLRGILQERIEQMRQDMRQKLDKQRSRLLGEYGAAALGIQSLDADPATTGAGGAPQ